MTTAKISDSQNTEKKDRACRFYYSWRGCRDGDDCLYKHISDAPACKYYTSKWGCWNGKHCRFRHEDEEGEEETAVVVDTVKQFYDELNQWLAPTKTAEDSPRPRVATPLAEPSPIPDPAKKFVSRGTQTKPTPDFVQCGECGEEFKSGRTLQQSLERHYIHKLASADFHHLRFFKHQAELRRTDPFCAACGEVFSSIESLLQHMGTRVSFSTTSVSVRQEHQSWFKQLVQPFVYRDLEVLDNEAEMVQRILNIYFVKSHTKTKATSTTPTKAETELAPKISSPGKFARKLQEHVNKNAVDKVTPYVHCEECGEIFDDPGGDQKLHTHYADMLTRGDGMHVWLLREPGDLEAHCSACKKTFLSPIALLQHLGSKQRLTASNPRPAVARHNKLLSDIVDIFVSHDMGMEGFTTETVGHKLLEIIAPDFLNSNKGPSDTADSPFKGNPDDLLHMARYFCRVNEWQAKMSYADYVKDDQERTRNHGFTIAEVEYLKSKNLTPTCRGVFSVLNMLYKGRRNPIRSRTNSARETVRATNQQKDVEEKEEDGEEGGLKGKSKRKRIRRKRTDLKGDQGDEPQGNVKDSKRRASGYSGKKMEGGKREKAKTPMRKINEGKPLLDVPYGVRKENLIIICASSSDEEEANVVRGKDDSMLEKVVEHSLHINDKGPNHRVYVAHDDGTIDVCIAGTDKGCSAQKVMATAVQKTIIEEGKTQEIHSIKEQETSIAEMYIKRQETMIAETNPQEILTATTTTAGISQKLTFTADTIPLLTVTALTVPQETAAAQTIQKETSNLADDVEHDSGIPNLFATQSTSQQGLNAQTKVQEIGTAQVNPEEMDTAEAKPEETVTEQAKPLETVTTQIKPEETATTQTKPEETVTAQTKPEETFAAQTKPEETVTAQTKPEVTVTAQTKSEVTVTAQTKPEETVTAQTKPEETVTAQPKSEEVFTAQTKPEAVVTEQTKREAVVTEQTKREAVVTEQTKREAVVTEQSKPEAVVTEQSKPEAVVTEQTKPEAVVTEQTKSEAVVTEQTKSEAVATEQTKSEELVNAETKSEEVVTVKPTEAISAQTNAKEAVTVQIKPDVAVTSSTVQISPKETVTAETNPTRMAAAQTKPEEISTPQTKPEM